MKDRDSIPGSPGLLDLSMEIVILLLKITFIVVFSVVGIFMLLARGK